MDGSGVALNSEIACQHGEAGVGLAAAKADGIGREAVLGMLPKNKLRARRAKKLRVYRDAAGLARHAGQKPQAVAL